MPQRATCAIAAIGMAALALGCDAPTLPMSPSPLTEGVVLFGRAVGAAADPRSERTRD